MQTAVTAVAMTSKSPLEINVTPVGVSETTGISSIINIDNIQSNTTELTI